MRYLSQPVGKKEGITLGEGSWRGVGLGEGKKGQVMISVLKNWETETQLVYLSSEEGSMFFFRGADPIRLAFTVPLC